MASTFFLKIISLPKLTENFWYAFPISIFPFSRADPFTPKKVRCPQNSLRAALCQKNNNCILAIFSRNNGYIGLVAFLNILKLSYYELTFYCSFKKLIFNVKKREPSHFMYCLLSEPQGVHCRKLSELDQRGHSEPRFLPL